MPTEQDPTAAVPTSNADALEGITAPRLASATSLEKGKGKRTAEEADVEERNAREKKRVEAKTVSETRAEENNDEDEDEDDDEEEEDEEAEGEDESDEEVDESFEEIDPSAIRSRRTRGVKVDYTSPEAFAKAGLKADEADEDE